MTAGASVAEQLRAAAATLEAAGVEDPRREARLLLEMATALSRTRLVADPGLVLALPQVERFRELIGRRVAREPVAYIRGAREFYGLDYRVGPGVLVPRPETELIVDLALERLRDHERGWRLLDLGVGSGCLLLTLLDRFRQARGLGVDRSTTALAFARDNALRLGLAERVELLEGSWLEAVEGPFDLVVANPPYIPSADIDALAPEVASHEPRLALDGGADGLDAYRSIAAGVPAVLATNGLALLEMGIGQAPALRALFEAQGFTVRCHEDLAGIARVLEAHME